MTDKLCFSGRIDVEENRFCADDVLTMRLSCPGIGEKAEPGQFVMIRAAEVKSDDPLLPRPFSIHWADSEGFEIHYRIVGRGTRYLSQLSSGDQLYAYGPLGRGFIVEPGENQLIVGGGMGVAPLLFLAGRIRTYLPDSRLQVVIGARCYSEITSKDRFNRLADKVRVATEDGSLGIQGLVTDLLDHSALKDCSHKVYSCGPMPMLKAVSQWCGGKGWRCQVSIETVMACGIGACLGCVVEAGDDLDGRYLHVCSEGPVFDSSRLW
ncbi:MAG: dihydroorotate dehydrogenase electron transfer subunit [Desulfobia sp.]